MSTDSMLMPPPMPPPLARTTSVSGFDDHPRVHSWRPLVDEDADEVQRYLNFECTNRKSPHSGRTWGWILENDYPAFKDLLAKYVRHDSRTFDVLSKCLRSNDDYNSSVLTNFFYDTYDGQKEELARYFDYKCNHKGKMSGLTWGEIFHKNPGYFEWAVRNTMGRDTKTFEVFLRAFSTSKQEDIKNTPRIKKPTV